MSASDEKKTHVDADIRGLVRARRSILEIDPGVKKFSSFLFMANQLTMRDGVESFVGKPGVVVVVVVIENILFQARAIVEETGALLHTVVNGFRALWNLAEPEFFRIALTSTENQLN